MRVIDAFNEPVRALAVSPDGRFLAASAGFLIRVFDWVTGESSIPVGCPVPINQLAFTADGDWLAIAYTSGLYRLNTAGSPSPVRCASDSFSGGIAISPDGRTLVATLSGQRQRAQLERWELPAWRQVTGFDFWSPFQRLAYSPNGEFLAGIDRDTFELRIAVTGGLNGRDRIRYLGDGFLAFARDSQLVVFGWETEMRVMETRAGAVIKRMTSLGERFADAAFVGSGQLLATVDGSSTMRLWSVETWEVVREYDWNAGGLTCVTATVDGLAGVCGTDAGRIVVFDVDD
jgi:WD40 repeat protein